MKTKVLQSYIALIAFGLLLAIMAPSYGGVIAQSGQPTDIVGLEWSPNGTRIANGTRAGTVFIRDTVTGQILYTLSGHTDAIISLAWNATGDRLASAGLDKTVKIWNTTNGSLIFTLTGHTASILSVIWSPDNTKVLSIGSGEQPKLRVWNATTGQLIQELNAGSEVKMAWSPDGTKLASANAVGWITIRDSSTLAITSSLKSPERGGLGFDVYQVTWHPNGTQIASGSLNGTVRVWNVSTQQILLTLDANDSEMSYPDYLSQVRALTFSSDGSKLLSFSADGTVRVWGSTSGTLLAEQQQSVPLYAAVFSPDANKLAYGAAGGTVQIVPVAGQNGPIVYVSKRTGNWDVYKINPDGSDDTSLTSSYTGQDWSPAWSPDGAHIVFKSLRDHSSGELYSMNADGSNVVRLTNNTVFDTDPDYSPDGSKILFSSARNGSDDELWTMNADGSGQTLLYDSAGDDNQPVWSPDGSQIAFASNQSGNWEVWVMPSTGGTATNLTNHASLDNKPAWSADGGQIAFISDRIGYDVYVMPSTGGTATNLSNHTAYDSYPAYSPDGTLMAFTSSRDGEQEVWTMTVTGTNPVQLTFNTALEWDPDWVALTAGNQALLSAPAVVGEAIPDNTPKPEQLNTLPAGKTEETQPDLFYVGAWVDETVAGASVRTTHSIGGEVWFSFEGAEVILHVVTRPDALPIQVCIDEVCQTIDLYSAQPTLSSIPLGNLTAGAHTVHIINDSAGYLSLDAVEVSEKQ